MKTLKHLFCVLAVVFAGTTVEAGFITGFGASPPPPRQCPIPPGTGGTGGSLVSDCSTCSANTPALVGMPDWKVKEPNIDLRIHDEPLAYQTSAGPMSFQIDYWQRDDRVPTNNIFTMGPGWECSWQAYIQTDGDPGDPVTFYGAGGGEMVFDYVDGSTPNYYYNLRLQSLTDTNDNVTGYELIYPDGALEDYNFQTTNSSGTNEFYLSQKLDPQGRTTTFIYAPYNSGTGLVQLQQVIDPDGKTNTLSYTNAGSYNYLISQVQDPYGHQVHFLYDTNGYLTNVTDVAGYSSSFGYTNFAAGNDEFVDICGDDYGYITNRWLNQLTTPYGTTRFSFTDEGLEIDPYDTGMLVDNGELSPLLRTLVVTEANGSHQMFAFDSEDSNLWANVNPVEIPDGTPDGSPLDDGQYLMYRNTFYWGRQQFANLSPGFLATGTNNWDPTQLSTGDFLKGRWRRWLHTPEYLAESDTLSMEADPSPDGVTPGEMTWYSYPGQAGIGFTNIYGDPVDFYQGTSDFPSLILKVLPDGTQWYEEYQMDQWGNIISNTNTYTLPDGTVGTRTNGFVYADNGQDLLQIIGPDGVTNAAYGYDDNHQVLYATNALGEVTRCTYNANEQLTSATSPAGLVLTNIYGPDGFVTKQIVVGLATNTFTYTNGLIYSQTDELGLTVTNAWDALQRLTNIVFPDGTSISFRYNKLDVATVIDRLGLTSGYGYNQIRQLLVATNPLGRVTGYAYCECGGLDAVTNALGQVTQFTHDGQGRVIQTLYPDGYTVSNTFNLVQQLTQTSDNAGRFLQWTYNNQGLRVAVSNALGTLQSATYDIRDRPVSVTDANGVTFTNAYDGLDRLLTRTWLGAGGSGALAAEGYRYTPQGLMAYTNRDQQVTRYGRNAAGWPMAETNANGEVNRVTRNPDGDVLTLLDGLNHQTTWQFNEYGWLTNKTDGLSRNAFRYLYNPNGWLTNRWTPEKGNTAYTFDNVGNLTNILYVAQASSLSFGYDANNELVSMQDLTGLTRFTRDPLGRLLAESNAWTTVSNTYSQGLRTLLSITQPGTNWTQSYAYDAGWRLTNTVSPAGGFLYNFGGTSAASSLTYTRGTDFSGGFCKRDNRR